jgi:Phage integrase family
MLHLTFAAGLRVSELISLRLEDLTSHPQASNLVHGKGRRERCLPLWKQTAAALRAWLAVREAGPVPGSSAIETEPFTCRRCTVNGSSRGTGWIEGVKTMSPVNGEIGSRKPSQTESTRHSPEGDIVGSLCRWRHRNHNCALNVLEATTDLRRVSSGSVTRICKPPRCTHEPILLSNSKHSRGYRGRDAFVRAISSSPP